MRQKIEVVNSKLNTLEDVYREVDKRRGLFKPLLINLQDLERICEKNEELNLLLSKLKENAIRYRIFGENWLPADLIKQTICNLKFGHTNWQKRN